MAGAGQTHLVRTGSAVVGDTSIAGNAFMAAAESAKKDIQRHQQEKRQTYIDSYKTLNEYAEKIKLNGRDYINGEIESLTNWVKEQQLAGKNLNSRKLQAELEAQKMRLQKMIANGKMIDQQFTEGYEAIKNDPFIDQRAANQELASMVDMKNLADYDPEMVSNIMKKHYRRSAETANIVNGLKMSQVSSTEDDGDVVTTKTTQFKTGMAETDSEGNPTGRISRAFILGLLNGEGASKSWVESIDADVQERIDDIESQIQVDENEYKRMTPEEQRFYDEFGFSYAKLKQLPIEDQYFYNEQDPVERKVIMAEEELANYNPILTAETAKLKTQYNPNSTVINNEKEQRRVANYANRLMAGDEAVFGMYLKSDKIHGIRFGKTADGRKAIIVTRPADKSIYEYDPYDEAPIPIDSPEAALAAVGYLRQKGGKGGEIDLPTGKGEGNKTDLTEI